jgi:hypothetical protein
MDSGMASREYSRHSPGTPDRARHIPLVRIKCSRELSCALGKKRKGSKNGTLHKWNVPSFRPDGREC